jgi:Fe-Mn family superoxide dismutase
MAFTLPPLPYPSNALEPYIDAQTMEIHHGKHHNAYVTNANKALEGTEFANLPPEQVITRLADIPESIRTAVRNNAGGHVNHSLFWTLLKRNGGTTPSGALMEALVKVFGDYAKFREEFTRAAMSVFGSGWAWLSMDPKTGTLGLEATPNQDSPYMAGRVPLLGLDVWEHAYYLKYQNKRADYVAAFFNVINWDVVAQRLANPA